MTARELPGAFALVVLTCLCAPARAADSSGQAPESAAAPPEQPASAPRAADPADPGSRYLQEALAARRAGDYEAAITALTRAYERAPQPSIFFLLGEVEQEAGHPAAARSAYERYLKLLPGAPDRPYVEEQLASLDHLPPPSPPLVRPAPLPPLTWDQPAASAPTSDRSVAASALTTADPPRSRRLWWVLGGVGVAATAGLVVGLVIGLRPTQPAFVVAPGALQ